MTTKGSRSWRWVSLFGMFMLLLSATPSGVAAQTGLTPVGDVAQDATTGMGIELLLVDCPAGAPADPSDLIPGCTDGRAGLNINVTSVDPALGIDQDKVSVKPSDPGPGVINTGQIPLGQYQIEIDLPVEDNNFFYECRYRGSTTNDVSVTPDPNGAKNVFLVNNDANVDVVCQAWITPSGENPTMDITYRECARADMPSDSRSFEDLQANCTKIATDPPTFNVRHLSEDGQPVSQHQQNAEGKLNLTLAPGDFDMFTDLDMNQWGEYLFCEYEGQPRYEKEFDPGRGIVTFTNLVIGEEFSCNWFAVNATGEATAAQQPAEVEEQPTTPDQPETLEPQETTDATVQNQQPEVQANAVDDVSFTITYRDCTRGDFPNDDRSLQSLTDNCLGNSAPDPTFSVVNADNSSETLTLDTNGVVTFTHAAENFTIYTNELDPNQWGEYLYCSFDGGASYDKPFAPGNINSFQNLNAGEVFDCQWFGVLASDQPSDGTVPPTAIPPTAVPPTAEPATSATFNLLLRSCPTDGVTWDTASVDAFRANCETGVENVVFNLVNDNEDRMSGVTIPTGEATITEVEDGNWNLWSEIPLEAATEYFFCSMDGGTYNTVQLSDRGVARFMSVDGNEFNCEIFVVPENLRGEVTGSSVEVHLSICPENYQGTNWYADCHDNGTSGQSFILADANGEVTSDAVVERTPGPAIARFTQLPAGDFELRGGPPQDFGTVFLYCSDPATNTQVETRFEGGMGYFSLAENQSVVCDWYFVPEDGSGQPTPTPEPTKAEIFTTMFICPPDVNVAGSNFSQLDSSCSERLSDVPLTLQRPGGVPITGNTGESGEGALRFYDLTGGDYVLTPRLPADYVSAAVYCDLNGGDVYQKALANGGTSFVDVDGELISCSWFVTAKPQPAPGPTGSITVREMLCEGDRSTIQDWERECQPATSGVTFTISSTSGDITQTLTPNADGVAVFSGLPNGYYDLQQSEGAWCRARAERVDSQSRLGVANGGNTDVFIYQCNQQIGLPDTGTGTTSSGTDVPGTDSILLGFGALPLFAIAAWQIRRWQLASVPSETIPVHEALTRTPAGYRYR